MENPNFTNPQFVDASLLNPAFAAVSGNFNAFGRSVYTPGLISPESASFSYSGMTVNTSLPAPFGVVKSLGTLFQAHGVAPNQDTQSYSTSFSGLVPSSGSVTAYLVATPTTVAQDAVSIPGPPVGHPSYNPNFTPTIGYALTTDTVALSATLTVPDNATNFELLRTTLTTGQSSITTTTTANQARASVARAHGLYPVSGSYAIPVGASPYTLYPTSAGLTTTMPSAAAANGLSYEFINQSGGNWTIAGAGSDKFYGGMFLSAAVASFTIPNTASAVVFSVGGSWVLIDATFSPTLGGVLTGTLPNPGLNDSGVTAGSYSSVFGLTVTPAGRISAISELQLPPTWSAIGAVGTGTIAVPTWATRCEYWLIGSGGGGGGTVTGNSGGTGGGGGGAGGATYGVQAVSPGGAIYYAVNGPGGGGGIGGNGATGGAVGLGSAVANGGNGGGVGNSGGSPNGGTGGSGNGYGGFAILGGDGADGVGQQGSNTFLSGGVGGASMLGGGGRSSAGGQAYGSGGGGGSSNIYSSGGGGQIGLIRYRFLP